MEVDRDKSGELVYTYKADNGQVKLRRENILHIPGLGFDGLIGYSPVAMAKNSIGMALATEDYGAAFFANGANPGGVLEHPGVIKPEQAEACVKAGSRNSAARTLTKSPCSRRASSFTRYPFLLSRPNFWRHGNFKSTKSHVSSAYPRI